MKIGKRIKTTGMIDNTRCFVACYYNMGKDAKIAVDHGLRGLYDLIYLDLYHNLCRMFHKYRLFYTKSHENWQENKLR